MLGAGFDELWTAYRIDRVWSETIGSILWVVGQRALDRHGFDQPGDNDDTRHLQHRRDDNSSTDGADLWPSPLVGGRRRGWSP